MRILLVIALLLLTQTAVAEDAHTYANQCASATIDLDIRINACDWMLQNGRRDVPVWPRVAAITYLNRGNAYVLKGNFEQAIEDYTRGIGFDPGFDGNYVNRGLLYNRNGEHDRAITDYDAALMLSPGNEKIIKLREEAIAARSSSSQTHDEEQCISDENDPDLIIYRCTKAIQSAHEIDRTRAPLYYAVRGDAFKTLKEYDRAKSDFDEAIRLKPDWSYPYYSRGRLFAALEEHDRAISDYGEAIRLEPDWSRPYHARGATYFSLEQYDRAILDFGEAIRLEPDWSRPYHARGATYVFLEQYDRAILDLDEAIRLEPDWSSAYYSRAKAFAGQKKHDRAIADFSKRWQLDPETVKEDQQMLREMGFYAGAIDGIAGPGTRAALEAYLRALFPASVPLPPAVSSSAPPPLAKTNRGPDSETLSELRRRAEQGDAEAQNELGFAYYNGKGMAKNLVEAEKWFRKAAEQGNAVAQYQLGFMYAWGQVGDTRDPVEAARWYREAAEQGVGKASFEIGTMYLNGYGFEKDYAKAEKWFNKAGSQGYPVEPFYWEKLYSEKLKIGTE